ncbi:MAG: hypothetical protein IJI16_02625 [Atopobiaceae bacterium]|nr:hypothetical protein [Atopobiaceae bacterium]MBQ6410827.1 hypothetical protein [Atopobiaceae bacterium]MBR3383813.1 hypothetical protein [Atopobiaceae bacterium]
MKLVSLGDNVCDCYLDEGVFYPGGQAVNVAVDAKRSGAERSAYLGVLADDDRATYLRDCMAKEGVELDRARCAHGTTAGPGVRLVNGDRQFFAGARDTVAHLLGLRIAREDLEYLSGFDVCHTTNEAGIDHELARIHQAVTVSYDFSDSFDDEVLERVCPNVDIAFFSTARIGADGIDALIEKAHALGCKVVVATRGEEGSTCSDGKTRHEQGICQVDAIDTMGAGDSFAAAFLVRYLDTDDIAQAMAFAAERAAHTCTLRGAFGYGKRI